MSFWVCLCICVCRLVCKVHVECLEMRRIGSFDDGGYDLCTSQPYHFTSNDSCIVYSFGSLSLSPILKLGHVTVTTLTLGVICHVTASTCCLQYLYQIRSFYLQPFWKYRGGPKISKSVTWSKPHPFSGTFLSAFKKPWHNLFVYKIWNM